MRLFLVAALATGAFGQLLIPNIPFASNHEGTRLLVAGRLSLFEADRWTLKMLLKAPVRSPRCSLSWVEIAAPSYIGKDPDIYSHHESHICYGHPFWTDAQVWFQVPGIPQIASGPGTIQWSKNGAQAGITDPSGRVLRIAQRTPDGWVDTLIPSDQPRYFAGLSAVADNGDALVSLAPRAVNLPGVGYAVVSKPQLWSNGLISDLGPELAMDCAIDPQSRYAICRLPDRLVVIDLATREERVLRSGAYPIRYPVISLSADGGRAVVYIGSELSVDVFLMPDGHKTHEIALRSNARIALSGNGRYLFVGGESLYRHDIETGEEVTWPRPLL
jgi:hypothetical protein